MATSTFSTTQLTSEQFVESTGAVLFDRSGDRVCLLHYIERNEWLLAKGRRNCGESRHDAALREAKEETGYACRLWPVKMPTRAPLSVETGHTPDVSRTYHNLTEPFMLTIREINGAANVKIIWWYIAVVDEAEQDNSSCRSNESCGSHDSCGEGGFEAEFFSFSEAVRKLTFQADRDVLAKAITLVEASREKF